MNKQELIEQVAFATDLTKSQVAKALAGITGAIEQSLSGGEPVVLMGFGTFETIKRAARTGRNPATGAAVEIAESTTVKFRAGTALKKAVR